VIAAVKQQHVVINHNEPCFFLLLHDFARVSSYISTKRWSSRSSRSSLLLLSI
jgi:hypothetical protein